MLSCSKTASEKAVVAEFENHPEARRNADALRALNFKRRSQAFSITFCASRRSMAERRHRATTASRSIWMSAPKKKFACSSSRANRAGNTATRKKSSKPGLPLIFTASFAWAIRNGFIKAWPRARTANPVLKNPKNGFPESQDELNYFDVLILGDLERKIFEQAGRFALVDAFVRQHGGGLATLGGLKVYGAGNYEDTTLARMLPFDLVHEKKLPADQPLQRSSHDAGPDASADA